MKHHHHPESVRSLYRRGFELYQWGRSYSEEWNKEMKVGWLDAERLDKKVKHNLKRKREKLE